ncbi:unnamed protein product [Adineta steineri]|uniref:CCHC-type domain-containing protein n=1 Tax=Adineta steineri TaxID=433720 RepID=A0A816ACE0_9BILA|nr:unnamed protein product [Adineta steineri]CAF1680548.1 unnamed protein product [Adineta steineri]
MDLRQLHSSQKEAMKKIMEFSGESNELDIDEWLTDLTNLFGLMKLKDETKILETMGKLTGSALRWYQENLGSFTKWEDAEKALRDRFKEFTSYSQLMQDFIQIQQEENQSVTSFYEHVMRKYKKAKQYITEQQVITVLQTGVKNSMKEYLIRNEKNINDPEEWLQYAREEEHIQKRIQQQRSNMGLETTTTTQPFFDPVMSVRTFQPTSSNNQSSNRYTSTTKYHHKQYNRPENNGTYSTQNNNQDVRTTRKNDWNNTTSKPNPCLICNRTNHPTIKCYYKKEKGCYKCGQSDHRIYDCPQQHFFE